MANLYSELQTIASGLLKDFSQGPFTLDVYTNSGTPYDPSVTYSPTPFDGTMRGVSVEELSDTQIHASDLVVTMPGTMTPKPEDMISVGGKQYAIVKLSKKPAAGTTVAIQAYVRG